MYNDDYIESMLKDSDGNYFDLILSPLYESFPNETFIPDEPSFPNACRYSVFSKNTGELLHIEYIDLKELVVQRLKKIHGIVDPWDDDLDYFKARKPG